MKQQLTLVVTTLFFVLISVLVEALVQVSGIVEGGIPQPEAGQHQLSNNFQDPIVWDASTLYGKATRVFSRQKRSPTSSTGTSSNQAQLVDACQSKMEIITPYYATNSKGKLRTIVNSELMQQAIQVETCVKSQTTSQNSAKCNGQPDNCGCEQKYKWHRLLVLDPHHSNAARGLFMDWFLFPSSCVCRCKSYPSSSKQFLRAIKS